jgi:hypothetical protein
LKTVGSETKLLRLLTWMMMMKLMTMATVIRHPLMKLLKLGRLVAGV